jgi:recombination endonuclease VII
MGWNKERYAQDAAFRERFCASQRARRLAKKDEINARRKGEYLQRLYGISRAEYDALLAKQGGRCAICRKLPKKERLCVDHCHLTGMVRGLLCRQCNFGLGCLGEDQRALVAALAYLGARKYDAIGSAARRAMLVHAALPRGPKKRAILVEEPLRARFDRAPRM